MIKKILNNFNLNTAGKASEFTVFFNEASSKERKKVIKNAVAAANNDQKALMERNCKKNPI